MRDDRVLGPSSLQKARFFLDRLIQSEQAVPFDQVAAEAYLEAAILFGKNVQYAIQAVVSDKRKCPHWNDPMCTFVSKLRDVVVHEDGSAEVTARTSFTAYLSAATVGLSSSSAILTVTYSNPTFRQRVGNWWQRLNIPVLRWRLRRRDEKRRRELMARLQAESAKRARELPKSERKTKVHFAVSGPQQLVELVTKKPEIESWTAADVISHYLNVLEQELKDLEQNRAPNA